MIAFKVYIDACEKKFSIFLVYLHYIQVSWRHSFVAFNFQQTSQDHLLFYRINFEKNCYLFFFFFHTGRFFFKNSLKCSNVQSVNQPCDALQSAEFCLIAIDYHSDLVKLVFVLFEILQHFSVRN